MRTAREPAQDIFRPHDGQRKALERAVDGCGHNKTPRPDHLRTLPNEQIQIGDMLDHLHGKHDIEALSRIRRARHAALQDAVAGSSTSWLSIPAFSRWGAPKAPQLSIARCASASCPAW